MGFHFLPARAIPFRLHGVRQQQRMDFDGVEQRLHGVTIDGVTVRLRFGEKCEKIARIHAIEALKECRQADL